MLTEEWNKKIQDAIWIGKSLFERGMVSGSSANISFLHNQKIYISQSGSCFGNLTEDQFVEITCSGGKKPSKEWPLHLQIYQKKPQTGAVIHTHSTYCVLWSFLTFDNERDCIPEYTPYLKMKLGSVGIIPYEKPGSQELFDAFGKRVMDSDGYLLRRHGPVVPGKNLKDAFYCLEELEESAKIAWMLKNFGER